MTFITIYTVLSQMTFMSRNTRFSRHFWACYQALITFNDVCTYPPGPKTLPLSNRGGKGRSWGWLPKLNTGMHFRLPRFKQFTPLVDFSSLKCLPVICGVNVNKIFTLRLNIWISSGISKFSSPMWYLINLQIQVNKQC